MVFSLKNMGKVGKKGSKMVETSIIIMIQNNLVMTIMSSESPFLLYSSCTYGAIRCNPGATGIEIIDNRDTIDTFSPHK
jgi:hypothetical protein